MSDTTPKIYKEKIKNTPQGVQEKITMVGQAILDRHELQGDIPEDYHSKPIIQIPLKSIKDGIYDIGDIYNLIGKINNFSTVPSIKVIENSKVEEILVDSFEEGDSVPLGLKDKDYFNKNVFIQLNSPEILTEILDNISVPNPIPKRGLNSEELTVGPFSYREKSIFYKRTRVENLTPQMVRLFVLFMKRRDEFILYSTIQDAVSTKGDAVDKKGMQKLVSKVRSGLKKHSNKVSIKCRGNEGYIFITEKLL